MAQGISAASSHDARPFGEAPAATRPRCVHCGARQPDPGGHCPRCFDPRPWRFEAGPSHVELLELQRPRRALRWLLGRTLPGLDARAQGVLAQQLAAVCLGPVRVLSFVDRRQAEGLARALGAAGGRCRVIDEPVWPWSVIALFLVVLLAITAVLDRTGPYVLAYLLYFLSEPLLSFLRARQSLLSSSRWPRSAWPALQLRAALLTLILVCISDSLLARGFERVTFAGAFAALTAGLGLLALAASVLGSGRVRGHRSPEPPWPEQLRAALLWGRGWQRGQPQHQARARPPSPGWTHALALSLAIGLVPLETAFLLQRDGRLGQALAHEATTDAGAVASETAFAEAPSAPLGLAPAQARALLGAMPAAALLLVLLALARRASALRQQGRRLRAAVRAPAAQGLRLLPWSVLLPRVPDLARAQTWLQTVPAASLALRQRGLRARLRQWPLSILCGAPPGLARQLVEDGRRQQLPLRIVYGWRSTSPRRLRDASALELGGLTALHALTVLGLGTLLLSAGASVQHLALLPPLTFLLGLGLLRQLPRDSLLRLRGSDRGPAVD